MLKLITKERQLPKEVLVPKLPIVLNTETNEIYELIPKGILVKDETYKERIPTIDRSNRNGVRSLVEILTGVRFSGDRYVDEFFKYVEENIDPLTNNLYHKVFSPPTTMNDYFKYLEVTRRLSFLIKTSSKYRIFRFDCSDRETVGRVLQMTDFNTNLVGYRCLVVGVKNGLKAVVDVEDNIDMYSLSIKVKGIVGNEGLTGGYLIPLYKL